MNHVCFLSAAMSDGSYIIAGEFMNQSWHFCSPDTSCDCSLACRVPESNFPGTPPLTNRSSLLSFANDARSALGH
jgi:hypothetical protein